MMVYTSACTLLHLAQNSGEPMAQSRTAVVYALAVLTALAALPMATSRFACAQDPVRHSAHDPSVVMTDKGPVRGTVAKNDREFLGVPYAAPPVGELRWKDPAPHATWTSAWDATHFGAPCAQPSFVPGLGNHSSEDCLYLNIWTPNPPRRHLPVMVWIHGGSFLVGSGQDADGSMLAGKRKVVVVSINYRLGPFGFLADKALDAEEPHHVSGNFGLLDQQAALKWVKANIAAFGGDPSRVTIFGESAGGISVCLQLESPAAAGLFERAINESGPCQMVTPIARAQAQGDKLAAVLGCDKGSDMAACMRSKPTSQVQAALPSNPAGGGVLWFPVVDGFVLPQTAGEAFKAGKFTRVPFINGSNHDEGTLFVAFGKPLTADQYSGIVRSCFGNDAARVMEEYPLHAYESPSRAWATVFTDAYFSCPIRRTTRLLTPQLPVYAYEFNDPKAPNTMVPNPHLELRAYHSSEIRYVFQTSFPNHKKEAPSGLSAEQLKLSDRMMTYWSKFAASGAPDGGSPKWSPYRNAQDQVLSFAPGDIRYESDFAKDHHCAFWETVKKIFP
jgi:para-nitrobenzyl esterase